MKVTVIDDHDGHRFIYFGVNHDAFVSLSNAFELPPALVYLEVDIKDKITLVFVSPRAIN